MDGNYGFTLILYSLTTALAIANFYVGRDTPQHNAAQMWYFGGVIWTSGHIWFATRDISLMYAVARDKSNGSSTEDMKSWLDMNFWRTITVDSIRWLCYLIAVLIVI